MQAIAQLESGRWVGSLLCRHWREPCVRQALLPPAGSSLLTSADHLQCAQAPAAAPAAAAASGFASGGSGGSSRRRQQQH